MRISVDSIKLSNDNDLARLNTDEERKTMLHGDIFEINEAIKQLQRAKNDRRQRITHIDEGL